MNKIFKLAQTATPPTPAPSTVPPTSTPSTTTPTGTTPSGPPVPTTPPATVDQNATVYGTSTEAKEEQLKTLMKDSGYADKITSLQENIKKLTQQKDQANSTFQTSQSTCAVYHFTPSLYKRPCDFVESLTSNTFMKATSVQEVAKNYQTYINVIDQLIQTYQQYMQTLDGARQYLTNDVKGGQLLNQSKSGNSLIDALKMTFQTQLITIQNEKTVLIKNDGPLLDASLGKSILDCYEEIIDLNEQLCSQYQSLQKSLSTLGMGPITVYAKQLIGGFNDIIRVYLQELTPIYNNIAQQSPEIDQKRVQYTLNLLSKTIPQSYKVQILGIEAGLFDITTQNNPSKLVSILGLPNVPGMH